MGSSVALHPSELLEQVEGDDFRVQEALERSVASGVRVEQGVGIVHEAEEHDHRLFQLGEGGDMLGLGQLLLLVVGSRMPLFLLSNLATVAYR